MNSVFELLIEKIIGLIVAEKSPLRFLPHRQASKRRRESNPRMVHFLPPLASFATTLPLPLVYTEL